MLTTAGDLAYAGRVTAFQPAGRTPAPAPLDLLQDFVNTEIPEWARDDLSTPEELATWLKDQDFGPVAVFHRELDRS